MGLREGRSGGIILGYPREPCMQPQLFLEEEQREVRGRHPENKSTWPRRQRWGDMATAEEGQPPLEAGGGREQNLPRGLRRRQP